MSQDEKIKESLYRENEKLRRENLALENDNKALREIIKQHERTIDNYCKNRENLNNALTNL